MGRIAARRVATWLQRLLLLTAALMIFPFGGIGQEPAARGGLWVAVGYGGRRITSTDGRVWENDQRWSDEAADNDDVLFNIAYGLGRFIAVGGGAKIGRLLSTTDGRTWRELPAVPGRVAAIAFGNGRFVAGHDAELLSSTDGETFTPGQRLEWKGSVHARRSACGDTEAGFRFVLIGEVDLAEEAERVSWRGVTGDGVTWQQSALRTPAARDVAYGSGHFVVVGPSGLIESSHDGETWVKHEAPVTDDFSRVVWSGSRFLVSGGKSLWTSPDGLDWAAEPRPIPVDLAAVLEGRIGIGFAWGGRAFWSADLVSWKPATIPAGPALNAVVLGTSGPR